MTSHLSIQQTVLNTLTAHRAGLQQFGIKSLSLFGSTARNQATDASDLDFLVEFDGPATFDSYMDLKFFLEDLSNRPIDLVTRNSLKPQIRQAILQEAVRVA